MKQNVKLLYLALDYPILQVLCLSFQKCFMHTLAYIFFFIYTYGTIFCTLFCTLLFFFNNILFHGCIIFHHMNVDLSHFFPFYKQCCNEHSCLYHLGYFCECICKLNSCPWVKGYMHFQLWLILPKCPSEILHPAIFSLAGNECQCFLIHSTTLLPNFLDFCQSDGWKMASHYCLDLHVFN